MVRTILYLAIILGSPSLYIWINFKLINQYQQKYPSLKAKYKMGTYQKDSFPGGSNIYLNLITCEDNTVIPEILQSCVLHW